jgi:hypothetical protein
MKARLAEPYGGGVGDGVGTGLAVGATVGVGVGGLQPLTPHASQQLENVPTHALPPFGALHCAAPFLIEQRVLPRLSVAQQVTEPAGLPHVERAAHDTTLPLHILGNVFRSTIVRATPRAHRTYSP